MYGDDLDNVYFLGKSKLINSASANLASDCIRIDSEDTISELSISSHSATNYYPYQVTLMD